MWVLLPHAPLRTPGDGYGWRWTSEWEGSHAAVRRHAEYTVYFTQSAPAHSLVSLWCPVPMCTIRLPQPMKSKGNLTCLSWGRVTLFTDAHTGLADPWASQNPPVPTSYLAIGTPAFQIYVPMPGFYLSSCKFKLWPSDCAASALSSAAPFYS